VQAALTAHHSFAALGDLSIHLWAEEGAILGDKLTGEGRELLWVVPPGAEVTVYVADRPVAYCGPEASGQGRYRLQGNGPHWLLVKRGLAWTVSSPIWVENQPVAAATARNGPAAEPSVQHAADGLRRQLEWLAALQPDWAESAMPVAEYTTWLASLLPAAWRAEDWAFHPGFDATAVAHARLTAAQAISTPLLEEVIRLTQQDPPRVLARSRGDAEKSRGGTFVSALGGLRGSARDFSGDAAEPAPRLVIAAPQPALSPGLLQFTVDVPRDWSTVHLVDEAGEPTPALVQEIPGQRDPIHSERTPAQIEEIYTWLRHGEMHEYVLRAFSYWREGGVLLIRGDLYPEALGLAPQPDPDTAVGLAQAVAAPDVAQIHVHLRMPRRFAVVMAVAADAPNPLTLWVRQGAAPDGDAPISFALDPSALESDPAERVLVVQVS
jgi:hypothetical protein